MAAITGLPRLLDQIEHLLPEATGRLGIDGRDMCELAYVGTGNEGFIAGSSQDNATYRAIISRILKGFSQILPCRRVQSI